MQTLESVPEQGPLILMFSLSLAIERQLSAYIAISLYSRQKGSQYHCSTFKTMWCT